MSFDQHLPSPDIDVHDEYLHLFFETMFERQEIWYKKTILQLPQDQWTKNEILRDYKFCNVYRELDATTQYLIKNVYLQAKKDDDYGSEEQLKSVVFCIIAHRIYNNFPLFQKIGYPDWYSFNKGFASDIQKQRWLRILSDLEEVGFKTLNQEAYKINTYIWKGEPRWKAYTERILFEYVYLVEDIVELFKEKDPKWLIQLLKSVEGVGGFLSHEFYQDFCDLNTYYKEDTVAFDKNSYTNVGPGAALGLRLIFPSCQPEGHKKVMKQLLEVAPEYLGEFGKFKYIHWDSQKEWHKVWTTIPSLTLHNIEFWLCEFAKYVKMLKGEGKQRSKYYWLPF